MTTAQDEDPIAAEGLTYGEALEELEALLDELEGVDVDVDHLAERVARGVQLVRFCQARLEVVTAEVDTVVAELITVEGAEDTPDPDEAKAP
ncbi:MAG: exodeoxyribonuclease VII small subunit [Actinomycetota bacterium]